jgi:DNA invertase Pin-like site-specific DNA recombinase
LLSVPPLTNLIALFQDEQTGTNMERPGFQRALARMVESGALLVAVSMDRLSRSVSDWTYLLDTYFGSKGKHEFLAFDIAGINPKTANGRTLLYMRAAMAECEALQTQERTQASMDKLRRDGVRVGGVPYGKAYSNQLDEHGRRVVVDVPEQIATIGRIRELYTSGASLKSIPATLEREKRPSPKGKEWNAQTVRCILRREGLLTIKQWDRSEANRDTSAVTKRISELRAENLSFKEIGARLTAEKLLPPIGAKWHAQTVVRTWATVATFDQEKAIELAVGLYRSGYSLRKIGQELTLRGITPQRGGMWHGAQVRQLLLLAKISA